MSSSLGDAHFFEESMNATKVCSLCDACVYLLAMKTIGGLTLTPTPFCIHSILQVRAYLASNKEAEKSRGMKFLLANMSKGTSIKRDQDPALPPSHLLPHD